MTLAGRGAEEGHAEDDVDGQPRRAGHERHEQAGDEALVAVLQRARRVDRRDRAAEAQDHGHERLAVEPVKRMTRSMTKATRAM